MSDRATYLESDAVVVDVSKIRSALDDVGGAPTPALITQLRKTAPEGAPYLTLLIDLALGTARAQRLGKALDAWLFTNTMAEQCTHPAIAAHHAAPFSGCENVLEICTGAALDTAALAAVCTHVTSYEADPLVAQVAAGNLRRAGIRNVTIEASAWVHRDVKGLDGIWADPSRRTAQTRQRQGVQYQPSLESIPQAPIVGIKVGPGDAVNTNGFISEYIGYGRECKERVLWQSAHIGSNTVTLVDVGQCWISKTQAQPLVVPQAAYIIEPHNAIIASGRVGAFFAEIGAGVFDVKIAYGAMNAEPPKSAWYTRYRVLKIDQGVSVRRIQESLRELGWGPATIFKKRGWEQDPEDLRRALSFASGGPPGVVIIMRVGGGHQTVYAEPATSSASL